MKNNYRVLQHSHNRFDVFKTKDLVKLVRQEKHQSSQPIVKHHKWVPERVATTFLLHHLS